MKTVISTLMLALITGCAPQTDEPRKEPIKSIVHPNDSGYLEWQLSRYKLEELNKERSIRFLWLRSFHQSIVFEIERINDDKIEFIAKEWNNGRWSTYSKKTLDADGSGLVSAEELILSGFFEMPNFREEDFEYLDGASWIFEAKAEGKHHWVWKQSPKEDTKSGRWGRRIIEESIDSPAVPIY